MAAKTSFEPKDLWIFFNVMMGILVPTGEEVSFYLPVESDYIFGGINDILTEYGGREDLYMVAVSEDPPCDFVDAVDSEFQCY